MSPNESYCFKPVGKSFVTVVQALQVTYKL